jgi:hypothetical protein
MNYLTTFKDKFEEIKKKVLKSKIMEGFEEEDEEVAASESYNFGRGENHSSRDSDMFDTGGYSTKRIKNAANKNDRTRATGLSIKQIEDIIPNNLYKQDKDKWKKEKAAIEKKKKDDNLSQEDYIKLLTPVIEKYFKLVISRFTDFFDDRIERPCDDDYTEYAGNCWKDIKTIKIFLMMPIANCIVIAVMSYLFAAFLFKIKSSPLALSKNGLSCKSIPLSFIFKKEPLEGIVREEVYKNKAKKHKYEKILFPWLAKSFYPDKPKLTKVKVSDDEPPREKFSMGYLLMLPFFLSLKYATAIWYSPISAVKKMLYKNKQWGVGPELKKINKEWWIKDFLSIFVIIPTLLFLIFPLLFILTLLIPCLVTPLLAWGLYIVPNKKNMVFSPIDSEQEGKIKAFLLTCLKVFKMFAWLLGYIMLGMFWSIIILGMMLMWFLSLFTGAHEGKRDGLKAVISTWANVVWDYKFIWAIMAIVIWVFNFKIYLKGPHSNWDPMSAASKNPDMTTGIIGGITIILLALKQIQFFKFLPKTPKYRKDCYPNCNPPSRSPDEMGLTKKCPPRSSSGVKI